MRHMIGYSIWNKVDHIVWLLEGIASHFDPAQTEVAFHFDTCEDGSIEAFDTCVTYWLLNRGWKPEHVHKIVSTTVTHEVGGHNRLIDRFMASNCDFLTVAQDDQHFNGSHVASLESLAARYGSRLGLVGGRDGYDWGYQRFVGSLWSESAVQQRLQHGEWAERPYQNSGPNIYSRQLIEKVGKLDEKFTAFYVWDDYGHRSKNLGFVNGILGMNMTHAKFGRMRASVWNDASGADLARLRALHGLSL